jgi:hypothetical protein
MVNAIFVIIGLAFLTLIGWAAKDFFTAADTSIFIRVLVGMYYYRRRCDFTWDCYQR